MNQYLRRKIWTLNRSGKFRGYLRTVSGYPVTLTDCMAGQPVSLAVDGNAIQDGTPTPDNPVDVQLCGDRILPLGYTAVEYIEGTGTQWIDTDIGSDENTGMYLEAALTEVLQNPPDNSGKNFLGVVGNNFLIGYQNNNDSQNFRFSRKKGIGITLEYDFDTPLDTNKHTFQNNYLNNHKFVVDEESVDAPDAEFKNTRGMAIFRTVTGTTGYYNAPIKAKIYRLKISQDIDIIADVYPAKRDSDGVVGMYDIISNTFFTNSGTGSFIAGDGLTPVYRVTGNVRGLNLLSSAWEEGDVSSSTGENSYSNPARIRTANYIECLPNTKYTFYSYDYIISGVRYYDEEKTYKGYAWTPNSNVLQFITPSDVVYIRLIVVGNDSNIVPDINGTYMLIEGAYTAETMPPYEPYREPQTFNIYTPQQLAKVGGTADTVVLDFDNKTAKLVNAVGIDDLSAENLRDILDNVCTFVCTFNKNKILQNSNVGTTNRFVCEYGYYEDVEKAFVAMRDYTPRYVLNIAKTRIGYTEEDTSDTLTQKANDWLSENETYGLYSIANPITTDITALQDWDAMPSLWSGTAVITADTVIAPSAITAKYYASKPEEVN